MRLHSALKVGFAVLAGLMLLAIPATTPVMAAEGQSGKDWEFNLAPFYLWGVSLSGDMTLGGNAANTVPVDVNFSDIFDNLSAAFIFHFEATNKNKWGLLADLNYLKISGDNTTPIGIKQDVDLELTLFELGGYYRVTQQQHRFDFLFGGRYLGIKPEVKLSGGPGPGRTLDPSKSWVDPFFGVRWRWQFADTASLIMRGDIGGFGIGSDFAGQGAILIDWQPFQYVGFLIGYRALYMNYKDGSGSDEFKYDATMYGPIVGINFRW